MASRKDIEAQIAALQAELEGADDDVELWVEHERGGKMVKTRLSGNHAKGWLEELFGKAESGGEETEEGGEETGEGVETEKPEEKKTYFRNKK